MLALKEVPYYMGTARLKQPMQKAKNHGLDISSHLEVKLWNASVSDLNY